MVRQVGPRPDPPRAPEDFAVEWDSVLRDAAHYFKQRATHYAAKDTGTLARAIPFIPDAQIIEALQNSMSIEDSAGGLVKEVHIRIPHAAFIEFGTEPHMPPIEPLEAWVRRNFSKVGAKRLSRPDKVDARKIAWGIAMNMAKHGTEPKPFIRPALRDAQEFLRQRTAHMSSGQSQGQSPAGSDSIGRKPRPGAGRSGGGGGGNAPSFLGAMFRAFGLPGRLTTGVFDLPGFARKFLGR